MYMYIYVYVYIIPVSKKNLAHDLSAPKYKGPLGYQTKHIVILLFRTPPDSVMGCV